MHGQDNVQLTSKVVSNGRFATSRCAENLDQDVALSGIDVCDTQRIRSPEAKLRPKMVHV